MLLIFRNALAEEKRRLDGRLATMEEDLEEEQMNYESAIEKARKAQEQLDQMTSEISQYQSNVSKLESNKGQLEKQVKIRVVLFVVVVVVYWLFILRR